MRKFLFNNFQIRVMLLFLVIALIPLAIVGAFSIRTAEQLIISTVSNQLENVADDKAAALEKWISERKADVEVIAGSSILRTLDPVLIAPYLQLVEKKYRVYLGFAVLSDSGEKIYSSLPGTSEIPLGEQYKQNAEADEPIISDVVLDPDLHESIFYIFVPIRDDDDRVLGYTCAMAGTHSIASLILKVSLGETGECYLVDRTGAFLAHKDPRRILSGSISQSESFSNLFGGGSQRRRIYTDYRGIEVLGASRQIPGLDWYLVVEQDRDEAFKAARRLERYVYSVIIISAVGAAVVSWLLSFHVVNPIRKLSNAAHRLAAGKFDEVLPSVQRGDEIGTLHNAFSEMAGQLQARQHSLEEKVEETEAELRETDVKLQKTMLAAARSAQLAALGRLAAGVTHEIRTPIASLKLFLQSVKAEIEISLEYEEDFAVAMNQIKRIEATINRFLDFAKPQEPLFSLLDLEAVIDEALLVVRPKANQQEIVVTTSIPANLPKIKGDRKQLTEVFVNLMVNALEAMPGRGNIDICGFSDHFEWNGGPCPCLRVDVSDTGGGIEGKDFPKLFDPFFTTKASGAGLGLSIVQSTLNKHGGAIRVSSTAGRGTTFSIFLPACNECECEAHGENLNS